jgi:hypothetical protein
MFEMLATFYSPLERPPRVDWDLCVRASFYEPSFGPFPTLALHRYTNDRLSAYRPRVRRCYRFLPKASAPSAQSLARARLRQRGLYLVSPSRKWALFGPRRVRQIIVD